MGLDQGFLLEVKGMTALRSIDRKVEELVKLAGSEAEYVPDDISRNDDWIAGNFGIQRRDGKFFRIVTLRMFTFITNEAVSKIRDSFKGVSLMDRVKRMKEMSRSGPEQQLKRQHLQPLVVQESNQYDRAACFKIIGHIALPIREREVDGEKVIEFGITAKRSPGAYAEVTFTAPRASLSNTEQLSTEEQQSVLYHRLVRVDPNRLTGRIGIWVLKADETKYKNCVWFTRHELAELRDHELMDDAPSQALINWVLGNPDFNSHNSPAEPIATAA